ncbi:MAG: DUF1523 family protein [Pseudomonadota bacterium]
MRYIIWAIPVLAVLLAGAWLHYTLPQKDIVRITNTEITRKDFSGWNRIFYSRGDAGDSVQPTRDLRLIEAIREDGSVIVYRNEDTSIGWPPYFKFDSADLQAEAGNLRSTSAEPQWVMVKHYGWRSRLISIHPNAVKIKAVDSPLKSDLPLVNRVPFFNIGMLSLAGFIGLGIYRLWQRFRSNRVDPVMDVLDEAWEDATRPNVPFGERVKSVFRRDR